MSLADTGTCRGGAVRAAMLNAPIGGTNMGRRNLLTLAGGLLVTAPRHIWAADAPWPPEVPAGTALVVADQNEVLQTVLAASDEKAKLGAKVTYANFLGGLAILEAFRAGALDLATVGNTPPIQAQAAGERIPIVAALRSSGLDNGLALRPGLILSRLDDLRGKRIGYAEGTARQPFVLKAAGLTREDVTVIPLRSADIPDAIRSGEIDVASLNEPHLFRYLADYADRGASALPSSEIARPPHASRERASCPGFVALELSALFAICSGDRECVGTLFRGKRT
jgi:sulfonate transport system substrate-binding protein